MSESKEILKDICFKKLLEEEISDKKYFQLIEFINLSDKEYTKILKEQGKLTYIRKTVHSAWIPVVNAINLATGLLGISPGGVTGGIGVWGGYRIIRAFFDKCTKQCGVFNINTLRRQICITHCKTKIYSKILKDLKDVKSKCNTAKDPKKCNIRLNKEIEKYEKRLSKSDEKWKEIQIHAKEKNVSIAGNIGSEKGKENKSWNLFRKFEK